MSDDCDFVSDQLLIFWLSREGTVKYLAREMIQQISLDVAVLSVILSLPGGNFLGCAFIVHVQCMDAVSHLVRVTRKQTLRSLRLSYQNTHTHTHPSFGMTPTF